MLTTRNLCLLIALGLMLGLEWMLGSPQRGSELGDALFPDFEPTEVTGIHIQAGERSVHLDHKNGLWVVRERADFYADSFLVEDLLKRLPDLRDGDRVAAEASSQGLYGLGPDRVHIQLSSALDAELLGFSIGRPAEETQGSYILPDGQTSIYRSAAMGVPQVDPALWINLHLVASFDMTLVQRIEIEFGADQKLGLERMDGGRWNDASQGVSIAPAKVQHLMNFAINAVLLDVAEAMPAAAGLEPPALSIAFYMEKGVRRLELGAPMGAGRAARSADWGGDWVVEVPKSTADSLEQTCVAIYASLYPGE
jgi:hypothetical protein